jgi:hypothetical protein
MATVPDPTDPAPTLEPLTGVDAVDLRHQVSAALFAAGEAERSYCECGGLALDSNNLARAVLDVLDDAELVVCRRSRRRPAPPPAPRMLTRPELWVRPQLAAGDTVWLWGWGRAVDELRAACPSCRLMPCPAHDVKIVLDDTPHGVPLEAVGMCQRRHALLVPAEVTMLHPAWGKLSLCPQCLTELVGLAVTEPPEAALIPGAPAPDQFLGHVEAAFRASLATGPAVDALAEGVPCAEIEACAVPALAGVIGDLLASPDVDPMWFDGSCQILAGASVAAYWRLAAVESTVLVDPGTWHTELLTAVRLQLAFADTFTSGRAA